MYLEHFKLKEMPFKITPDPRFLNITGQHEEAFSKCLLTIKERGGLVVVDGEIGMGKTTIARRLLDVAEDQGYEARMLTNPALKTENAFLRVIMEEFGVAPGRSYAASLMAFQDFMLESYEQGKNLVLIIDEAQLLTPRLLNVLHALLNFESNTAKFLQMVLIGQNELAANIERQPHIKSRVARFARLSNLSLEDTKDLIRFRWAVASGAKSSDPFTDVAIKAIYLATDGLPRGIIKLCHESLLFTASEGSHEVTDSIVVEAAEQLRLKGTGK
jgi:general secretion pathway protein A